VPADGGEARSGGIVKAQQWSRSSDGGLAQHQRRRLILKTINRSWPTSTSSTPAAVGPRDSRSVPDSHNPIALRLEEVNAKDKEKHT